MLRMIGIHRTLVSINRARRLGLMASIVAPTENPEAKMTFLSRFRLGTP